MKTILACALTAVLTCAVTAGVSLAGSSAPTVQLKPGQTLTVQGYSFTCEATSQTPNFSCAYGPAAGPSQTPIWTAYPGSRKLDVQSTTRPKVQRSNGTWNTTVTR
jgi:hypothetical protein